MSEQVVIITGASGAIGHALAVALAGKVRGMVLFGRSMEAESDAGQNSTTLYIKGDITSPGDVQMLCNRTLEHFGRIDALVNCAGIVLRQPFLQTDFPDWQQSLATNMSGYALLCAHVLPHMIDRKFGRIVNLTTRIAATPVPGMSAYSSSKAAAHAFTRSIALEIQQAGHTNILINDIVPGSVRNKHNDKGQDPAEVAPYICQLLQLPDNGPTGKTFFKGKRYRLFGNPLSLLEIKMLLIRLLRGK